MKEKDSNIKTRNSVLEQVRPALELLSGKWKLPILISLMDGERRFGELAKDVDGITERMLSKELRELELSGLLVREVVPSYPVRITYKLTKRGSSVNGVIDALRLWGAVHQNFPGT